ncbi:protein of unknown function [Methylorubrum extorquens]|uniref:Uncharacterized protein n=1 Tax=Methylorubrum extorquens TaxID=408 RepID=A0A2N9AYS9_METEX|nr:hypothetical protein [Methylobacterium sp. Leaf122]KQQ11506.1 hypothetical protein ASF56_24875 [Methylobacterium sp. Leaf122]SOR32482.1 protein of unknown function [Methylorubrum extorquens]
MTYAGTNQEDVIDIADVDVDQWLEGWVENNLTSPGYVEAKAEMRDQAEACAVAAKSEDISIAVLKEAAGGDLEAYLLDRQNALTDAEVGHRASRDA